MRTPHPLSTTEGESFAWVNVLALARLNAVTLTCLLCFLLRAVDLALPSHRYARRHDMT